MNTEILISDLRALASRRLFPSTKKKLKIGLVEQRLQVLSELLGVEIEGLPKSVMTHYQRSSLLADYEFKGDYMASKFFDVTVKELKLEQTLFSNILIDTGAGYIKEGAHGSIWERLPPAGPMLGYVLRQYLDHSGQMDLAEFMEGEDEGKGMHTRASSYGYHICHTVGLMRRIYTYPSALLGTVVTMNEAFVRGRLSDRLICPDLPASGLSEITLGSCLTEGEAREYAGQVAVMVYRYTEYPVTRMTDSEHEFTAALVTAFNAIPESFVGDWDID